MIGRTLGHYHVLDEIGAGGMGVVYRARDERLERDVALKVLPAGSLADEATRKRFRSEALALSRLSHPNIAVIHDFNSEQGVDFLAMEYIPGTTLEERLRSGPLPENDILRIGRQIGEALTAAHEQGVVHRDLKPGNIMITPKGLVKVLDFGLAKLLQPQGASAKTLTLQSSTSLTGTLPYMAPEQLDGHEVDARTDIHALGAILYELAARRRTYPQETPSQVIRAILHERPETPRAVNPDLSEGLEQIIFKCLEKKPADRYASAEDFVADIDRLQAGESRALTARRLRPVPRARWGRRLSTVAGIAILAAAGLVFGLNVAGLRDRLIGAGQASAVQSLAVLPLKNLSQDPQQDYLADGLTDSLITELGQISTLRVTSTTSVYHYKKTDELLPQIAKELKADLIVEGSVLRSGDKARITAKLIRPADERQLWLKSYERRFDDVLALQRDIAGDITRQIGIRLSQEASLRLSKTSKVDPQALDAYLKGVYSDDGRYFAQAVKIDPDFALAYTRIASGYFYAGLFGSIPPREAFSKMEQAALKALEKDDSLGEAHGYLAVAYLHNDLDGVKAEKEFKRAFELNPSLAMIHHLYAHYLMAMNRTDESMTEVRLAQELDPFAWDKSQCFGWHCLFTKGYDEAIEEARRGIALEPKNSWAHIILGWAYEQEHMLPEAEAQFQAALGQDKDGSLPLAGLGHLYGISGQAKAARKVLDRLLELSKQKYVPAYDIAVVYMGLGERDRAYEWLAKAYQERSGFLIYIKCDRRFDDLHADPRFQALLKQLGVPPVAAES